MDTLPFFRAAIHDAGLEDHVVAVVGRSPDVARHWSTPAALVFIDGGHGAEPARADYAGWAPHVALGGTLAIHDVFPDPADGGRPPYEDIFVPALTSGRFRLASATGSLRTLHAGRLTPDRADTAQVSRSRRYHGRRWMLLHVCGDPRRRHGDGQRWSAGCCWRSAWSSSWPARVPAGT